MRDGGFINIGIRISAELDVSLPYYLARESSGRAVYYLYVPLYRTTQTTLFIVYFVVWIVTMSCGIPQHMIE